MTRSKHTAAHFTYVEEIDMTELVSVRERARARAADRGGQARLPAVHRQGGGGEPQALADAQARRSTRRRAEIVRTKYYHIGIAAQGPQGQAVSVVRGRRPALDQPTWARDRPPGRGRAQRRHRLPATTWSARPSRSRRWASSAP
ncbi:MAG: 2-oxo acid dehydrogenase subunit E2 [Kofleriaceae bacterium]|nr:2-oxo acid dehydrogenase subunit E2 [Kofleriaceae bacterium]